MSSSSISRWQRLKTAVASIVYSPTSRCATCHQFTSMKLIRPIDLGASARSGCRYCVFILHACEHFHFFENPKQSVMVLRDGWISTTSKHGSPFGYSLEMYTPAGHLPAWNNIPQDPNPLDAVLNQSPRTSEAYEFIRTCLRDCDAHHSECQIENQELPTRLLDLGHKDPHQVVMIETGSLSAGHKTTYIALSYCWGKGQSLTLTSETVEAMKKGFMVSSLPQTLQDAITVTRALGQRYIWVDALCIIQNSPTDWQVESSRMASVYHNAYLTIASATASNVTEGFLSRDYRETNAWYREPYHEEWINHEGNLTILGARHSSQTPQELVPIPPWNLRGWTLQEQLLSRRLLKYHAYELRWVCQNKSTYQCHSKSCKGVDPRDRPIPELKSAAIAYEEWRRVVIDYTSRELTKPLDKLPAISGLANVFQRVIQARYIAGIWESKLLWDLLWTASQSQTKCAPEPYIAPTFSWASISSPVKRFAVYMSPYFEWTPQTVVEGVCSVVDGENTLGRVKDGWIQLRGYIFKANLIDYPKRSNGSNYSISIPYLSEETTLYCDTCLDKFEATNENGDVEVSVRRMRQPSSATPQDNEPPVVQLLQGAVVRLLLVGQQRVSSTYYFSFIVLGLSSNKPGTYERLGFGEHIERDLSRIGFNKFISGLKNTAEGYKTITIV